MFDGMFPKLSESFTQDFVGTQPDEAAPSNRPAVERELGKGVLHTTIASIHQLARAKAFDDTNIKAFQSEWTTAIIVGWITETEETKEGVLTGQICDGTGSVDFRYELENNMTENYALKLNRLKPVASSACQVESETPSVQLPTKMIGSPTIMNEELMFAASHLKAATPDEVISSHFLECALTALSVPSESHMETHSPPLLTKSTEAAIGVDPYYGDEIQVPPEILEFMGAPQSRLKQVIWRFLTEAQNKEFSSDKSESCVAVRSFCSKRWTEAEVNSALEELDEVGVLFFMDDTKERVCLA